MIENNIVSQIWKAIQDGIDFSKHKKEIEKFKKVMKRECGSDVITEYNFSYIEMCLVEDYLNYIGMNALVCEEDDSCSCGPYIANMMPCGHYTNLLDCIPTRGITKDNDKCALADQITPIERYACAHNFECDKCYFNKETYYDSPDRDYDWEHEVDKD